MLSFSARSPSRWIPSSIVSALIGKRDCRHSGQENEWLVKVEFILHHQKGQEVLRSRSFPALSATAIILLLKRRHSHFMTNFDNSIAALDLSLFSAIESQSTAEDKASLLACQLAVRSLVPGYRYLEIGSHLGGSIQPHLRDPLCSAIVSIDKRPQKQPDERGFDYTYLNNSTERMLENLRRVDETAVAKITTIDGGTDEIAPDGVGDP